ncbi:hypothetical protein AVEN_118277-1 [Araneus ventricosus]|uniref:SHSP domain-containing protein n=1 Tax=Araneus ventricosus TaxID=182803 RepID=A0A4Y2E0A7_ARAVE|nr:hypothetical protein AVEN_118277-1 [Araneus ventricosus]
MLKSNPAVQDMEVASKVLKDKPEVQNVELANKLLRDQLARKDSELLKKLNQLSAEMGEVKLGLYQGTRGFPKQVDPTPPDDIMWNERFKFFRSTLENLKSGKSKVDKAIPYQLDANFPGGYARLEERSISLDHNLTKDIPEDFKICIDCKQFKSNELKVIVEGGCVLVQGNHDLKFDEHGLIKREFTRRLSIPEDVNQEKFSSLLDRYGILTIRAPRKVPLITIPIRTEKSPDSAFHVI